MRIPYSLANHFSNIYCKILEKVYAKIHIQMFISVSFMITNKWKQSICTSTVEQINKYWLIHTVQYWEAMKINELELQVSV